MFKAPQYTSATALLIVFTAVSVTQCAERELSQSALADKIRGGWAGKMIGVAYGAPTEFRFNGVINDAEISWSPAQVAGALGQDDLYVGMTLAETMDRLGLDATTEQYGEAFKHSKYDLWHANAAARKLLNAGVTAPMSGHPKYNIHANDIDFQIEADFIGMMCPGLPQESNRLCDRVGRVMGYGDGLYGGMFVCGMYAAAFFEPDPRTIVEQGLACLPQESQYAQLIQDVLDWSEEHPGNWRTTWRLIEEKWDKDDPCPDGALLPFNIDAKINGGYIALGLLYGEGDFAKTLEISTRAGQDSDCNPSSAAGILGVAVGYEAIPEEWKSGVPAVADEKFRYTDSSLNDVCDSTMRRAHALVERIGGQANDQGVVVPEQLPAPAALEQWSMGIPLRRDDFSSDSYEWDENWNTTHARWGEHMASSTPGAEVTFRFDGTAVAISGACTPEGGRADVFLDGQSQGRLDAYADASTNDNDLWHTYGQAPGPHEVRIVLRGDAHPRSAGAVVMIRTAIIYGEQ